MDDRRTFLLEIYRQMFSDIDRHLTVVWQSVSVVVGAFALLALSEKEIVPADVAISLIVLLSGWLYAHMIDAGYWYNRNLVIIANIERQFLEVDDLRHVHFYWGSHRSVENRMITHIKIQAILGVALGSLAILFHFASRVWDGLFLCTAAFDPVRTLPYLSALAVIGFCIYLAKDRDEAYTNFRANSPGIEVDATSVNFGPGHMVDQDSTEN